MENYRIQRIKGDIVETICKNHFAAMGFQVENAGVEHFATQFANRPGHQRGKMGGTNVNKIQNYIGRLPDLLVGHEKHDHHFVEAKFRANRAIHDFAKELLWDYRRQIFGREFNDVVSDLFNDVTRRQWEDDTEAFDLPKDGRAHLDVFMTTLANGVVDPEAIQVPMMFYVVIKDGKSFALYLIRFDEENQKFLIHQAGKATAGAPTDIATQEFLSEFDRSYAEVVAPVLRDVFSAELEPIDAQPEEPKKAISPGSILEVCLSAALKINPKSRYGVYFGELLGEVTVKEWLGNALVEVNRHNLKNELEKCGLSFSHAAFTRSDGKEYGLYLQDFKKDFYFSMR